MATIEECEINARLKTLKKELERTEALMKQAAISYEDIIAEKESLVSAMEELRKTRNEMRGRELRSV